MTNNQITEILNLFWKQALAVIDSKYMSVAKSKSVIRTEANKVVPNLIDDRLPEVVGAELDNYALKSTLSNEIQKINDNITATLNKHDLDIKDVKDMITNLDLGVKYVITDTIDGIEIKPGNIYLVPKVTEDGEINVYTEYLSYTKSDGSIGIEKVGDTTVSFEGYATENYVNSKISDVNDSISAESTSRSTADSTLQSNIDKKVDKVSGKGLSTNDYTTAEKTKLSGIAEGANKTTVDSTLSSTSTNPVQNKIVNTALGNKVDKVSGKGLSTNDFTTTEKTKLSGIAEGANKTVVDSAMSSTSTNPVQNKIVNTELGKKVRYAVTTMVSLGFTANSLVTIRNFWNKLLTTYGANGVIAFSWATANQAYVGTSDSNKVVINGGTLVYTSSGAPGAWRDFSALYYGGGGISDVYYIKASIADDTTVGKETVLLSRLVEASELSSYAKTTTVTDTINTAIAKVVASAPEDFDTLKEMSDWISSHEDSAAAMNTAIAGKASKDLSNVTGTLPVSKGGTGATTAAAARTCLGITLANLGAAPSSLSNCAGLTKTGTVTSIAFQCAGTTKCTATSTATINLSANAWNTNATISTTTYPGACCTGTSNLTLGTTATTAACGTHTHSAMKAATASAAGTAGMVPAPAAGKQTSFLRGDGTWVVPTNTTYSCKAAATDGTDVSLVTTGEKAIWNAKSNLAIGTTATTAAAGNHSHSNYLTTSGNAASATKAQCLSCSFICFGTNCIWIG